MEITLSQVGNLDSAVIGGEDKCPVGVPHPPRSWGYEILPPQGGRMSSLRRVSEESKVDAGPWRVGFECEKDQLCQPLVTCRFPSTASLASLPSGLHCNAYSDRNSLPQHSHCRTHTCAAQTFSHVQPHREEWADKNRVVKGFAFLIV